MLKGIWSDIYWFEDGSSVPLDYFVLDSNGVKHLALTDSNGICPLHDFLCFDYVSATKQEVMEMITKEYIITTNNASVVKL